MARLAGSNMSRTWGLQCPDGHGTLLGNPSWEPKLYCPNQRHDVEPDRGFFEPTDPRLVEGHSPRIREIFAEVRAEEAAKVVRTETERTHVDRPLKAAIAAKIRASSDPSTNTGPECLCGCGERTKGGRFRPGHDARYHAAQKLAAHGQPQ